tara:strand:- start:17386 stop:17682 length:297 start_codon:yes stop_codon:yes gene_type:complete
MPLSDRAIEAFVHKRAIGRERAAARKATHNNVRAVNAWSRMAKAEDKDEDGGVGDGRGGAWILGGDTVVGVGAVGVGVGVLGVLVLWGVVWWRRWRGR